MAADGPVRRRSVRSLFAWLLTVVVLVLYAALPDGDESAEVTRGAEPPDATAEAQRVDVTEVVPVDPSAGAAVTISYMGANDDALVRVFVGKQELKVLARRRGSVVARLPASLSPGRVKLRVTADEERSKPYDLRIKPPNWQKPFRNLLGGFALVLLGISVLARGARQVAGLGSAQALLRLSGRGPAALGLGAVLGALAQSTTGAAGLLSGLVSSSLLAVTPAAVAFLGAQIGASTAPLVTGLIEPREGLIVIALGAAWLAIARDRRSSAIGRLLLGAGLIAFGLQTLRPGLEPVVQEPALLGAIAELNGHGVASAALCALLGAGLVALLQGPAPVVVLVLVLAQTTAQWDLRTALAVLSGSSFGAAIGALLTIPRGRNGRELASLNLLLGLLSSLLAAVTVPIWTYVADWLVPGVPHEISWGKRVLLPNLGLHLGVAFTLSQLACALAMWPLTAPLSQRLRAQFFSPNQKPLSQIGDPVGVTRAQLVSSLSRVERSLPALRELSVHGERSSGRVAEQELSAAHAKLEELIAGPVRGLGDSSEGRRISALVFTSLQVQRALEDVRREAERLLDTRIADSVGAGAIEPLTTEETNILVEIQSLLAEGLRAAIVALQEQSTLDVDAARGREIQSNALEAAARSALLVHSGADARLGARLAVLELVDACETAGNQLYRLSESLGDSLSLANVARVV